jgi:hypothetical protein
MAMSSCHIVGLIILCSVLIPAMPAQEERPRGPVLRQIDHVLIESGNPGKLFDFFTDTLQLPTAWPIADNQGYVSGGVGAGNVDIAIYRHADGKTGDTARFTGLAFEPVTIDRTLYELRVRGIEHTSPEPYIGELPNGKQGALWTLIDLPSFPRPGMSFFLYGYSPEFLRIDIRRKQHANRITLRKGGPLGFRAVREIILTAKNQETGASAWDNLLGKRDQSGKWRMLGGPSISLIQGTEDRVQEMVLQVDSLERATAWLREQQLLGSVSRTSVTVDPSIVQGLAVRLIE